jgi:hypothetical protein
MAAPYWGDTLVPPRVPGVVAPGEDPAPADLHPSGYVTHAHAPPGMAGVPVAGTPGFYCDDRPHADPVPAGFPCASAAFQAFPHGTAGNARKDCTSEGVSHGPGNSYAICGLCIHNNRRQQWYTDILQDLRIHPGAVRPPALPMTTAQKTTAPTQPIETCRDFLAYLCRECEDQELAYLNDRVQNPLQGNHAPVITANILQMIGRPNAYPYHTCTCAFEVADRDNFTDKCIRHLLQDAGAEHNRKLAIRQQNDWWLRNTGIDPNGTGRVVKISHQKRTGRARRKVYRACRCGAETKADGHQPQVTPCLGCEGIVGEQH